MKQILKWLKRHDACEEGIKYSKQFTDPQKWWDNFERGDWMLWVIWRCINRKDETQLRKLTGVKVKCARLAQHSMKDQRSLDALDVAEQYSNGEVDLNTLKDAAYAAYAADDAAAAAAYAAAYAAANDAAYAAANAAAAAAYAAYAAANDAADAAAANAVYAAAAAYAAVHAAREEVLKKCANIVRETYTVDEIVSLILS